MLLDSTKPPIASTCAFSFSRNASNSSVCTETSALRMILRFVSAGDWPLSLRLIDSAALAVSTSAGLSGIGAYASSA